MIKKLFHFIFVLLLLALVIGIPGTWMLHRSYSDPEVHYFYTKEGEGDQSLRFVVISDLYGYVFEGGNGVIADQAGNTFPDAILIGGNMITADTEDLTPLTDLIKRLVQIAPVYYSYGEQELKYAANHSTGDRNEVKRRYQGTWNFLNDYQNTENLKIMLSIRPESFLYSDACQKWDLDLVVSGNDLGGLVVVPHYGGVFGGSQGYFPDHVHGMFDKDDVKLFITSGLSAPKGMIPRLNNPPEIAVVDIDGLSREQM